MARPGLSLIRCWFFLYLFHPSGTSAPSAPSSSSTSASPSYAPMLSFLSDKLRLATRWNTLPKRAAFGMFRNKSVQLTPISHLIIFPVFLLGLPQVVCALVAALLHFFFLSSFCWVLTEAWQSYMAVTGRLRNRIIRKRFLCLGWGKTACLSACITLVEKLMSWIWALTFFPLSFAYFHLGLPALVVAVSVGFTKANGYGTVN